MKRTILCLLVAASGLAKEQETIAKPVCMAAIHGRFWPDAANSDGRTARKLAQCGLLEMCSKTMWSYKWKAVTVNVRQLGKEPQEPTPACAAVMEEFSGQDRQATGNY